MGVLRFIVRRLFISILVFLGITMLAFFIATTNPDGGLLASYIGRNGASSYTNQQIDAIRHRLGLDQPEPIRYLIWLRNLLHGDLGSSVITQQGVGDSIHALLIPTLLVMGLAFVLRLALAVPLGVLSALQPGSLYDQTVTVLSYLLFSFPTFWLGLMAIVLFSADLHWLPFGGLVDLGQSGSAFGIPDYWAYFHHHTLVAVLDLARHLVLPVTILGLAGVANDSRFVRASMRDVLTQNYIRTARAKGLRRRTIIWKHIMRNGLLPITTNIGLELPSLIGGAVIIETIFSLPGMGNYFVQAAQNYDYPVVIAVVVMTGGFTLLINIITDLTYAFVDPRIRYT